ncbi:hypothetical protein DN752_20780 [Echinicola strongylocentroti]|uniref:Uncharacterized protein n=1 Tax=Echinicola strongylocentroti TaxID=1795355 RepID=A0A2Z4INP9_9BACT|nr:hypothetical protein [Echinicola strongylocentroti]AWW32380.1 hypothetical protein DN752_20780 [Echinicola strongylocentroti]
MFGDGDASSLFDGPRGTFVKVAKWIIMTGKYLELGENSNSFWSALKKDELPFQPSVLDLMGSEFINQPQPKLLVGKMANLFSLYKQEILQAYKLKCRLGLPVVIFDKKISLEKILLHYDGKEQSARNIKYFVSMFENELKQSQVTIISPDFIPKSRIPKEASLVQLLSKKSSETSFIKFNFTQIEQFWNYGMRERYTMIVTSKNYMEEFIELSGLLCKEKHEDVNNCLSIYLV